MLDNFYYLSQDLITTLSNLLYIFVFLFAAFIYFYNTLKNNKAKAEEHQKEIDIFKDNIRKEKRKEKSGFIYDYLNLLESYFTLKSYKKPHDLVKLTIFIIAILSTVISYYNIIVGVMSFPFLNLLVSVVLKNINETKINKSEYKLPEVIDTIIRSFSKNDELQVVLYETSLITKEPFNDLFSSIAREMTSSGHLFILNKYSNKTNSIWLNSLFSILIKYKEDAKKEDTIVNLKHLRNMIAQENDLKRKLISDKRYSVVLNYIIAGISVLGNLVVFIFFPQIAKTAYLSSPFGMLMLACGYICVAAVVITTKKLGNKENLKVEE